MGKRVTTISGIAGFGSLLAGVGAPKVIEGLPPWASIALFASGAVLIVAAFLSHLLSRKEGGDGGIVQTTHGPNSPTLQGAFHGPVTVNAPSTFDQDLHLKEELARERNRKFAQAVMGTKPPMEIHPDALLEVEGLPVPEPDLPLSKLLERVYEKLGPVPPEETEEFTRFYKSVDREIANQVKLKQMRVWGHIGSYPIRSINQRQWDSGTFHHLLGAFTIVSGYPDPVATTYTDLYFNKAEVDRVWPLVTPNKTQAPTVAKGADFPEIGSAILDRYKGEAETFPYRKAVLQIHEIKATAERQAGAEGLSKIACHMDIENHTKQQFDNCRVRLVSINGEKVGEGVFLRIGALKGKDTKTQFHVRPNHSKSRINFMKRDLEDVVSNPPFLLCLNDRDLPLSDGKEYRLVFALECEYEHPTFATVRCCIPERDKIEIELVEQSLDDPA